MNEAQLLEVLALVMSETDRPHTAAVIRAGGEVSSISQGTCLIAMRWVRDYIVNECANEADDLVSSIKAKAE